MSTSCGDSLGESEDGRRHRLNNANSSDYRGRQGQQLDAHTTVSPPEASTQAMQRRRETVDMEGKLHNSDDDETEVSGRSSVGSGGKCSCHGGSIFCEKPHNEEQLPMKSLMNSPPAPASRLRGNGDSNRHLEGAAGMQSELTCSVFDMFEMPCFTNPDATQPPGSSLSNTMWLQPVRVVPVSNVASAQCGASNVSANPPNVQELPDPCVSSGRPPYPLIVFIVCALLLPFAIEEVFIVANHFANSNPKLCGTRSCPCSPWEVVLFVFTFGLHLYIPLAAFTPMLFFLTYDAVEKDEREKRLYARVSRYVVADENELFAFVNPSSDARCTAPAAARHVAATRLLCDQTTPHFLKWVLPPCTLIILQNLTFWVLVAARFVLIAVTDTQLSHIRTLPAIWHSPLQAAALVLPLMVYSMYKAVSFLVIPYVLLDTFPLLLNVVGVIFGTNLKLSYMMVPLLIMLLERCFWYCAAFTLPKATPIGIKVALSTAFAAMYLMATFVSSLLVDIKSSSYVVVVMAVQVLVFELLFSTLFVEIAAHRLYSLVMNRALGRNIQMPRLQVSDPINISTQVRWAAIPLAVCGILPLFQFSKWHRTEPRSTCRGVLAAEDIVYSSTFLVILAVCILACVVTALIRRRHGCLRAPLVVQDCLLLFVLGWYVFSLVPLALAAML